MREAGQPATRDSFISWDKRKYSKEQVVACFGGWTQAMHACGIEKQDKQKKRTKLKEITERLFSKDLAAILTTHQEHRKKPAQVITRRSELTLIIGDVHAPFISEDAICSIYEWADRNKPDRIIQAGDLFDMFAHTKFPRTHNIYTPQQEYQIGRKVAEELWSTLQRLCPGADCYQLLGNHDARPLKRLMESFPTGEMWFNIAPAFTFDGVTTVMDPTQELIFEDYYVHHGYLSRLGDHRDYTLMNAVTAHSHVGGLSCRQIRGTTLWELNVGYVGDETSKALSYSGQRMKKWTLGFGVIDRDGPRFVPIK